MWSSHLIHALMVQSWVKGWWHNLKVPSINQVLALALKLFFSGKDKMASTVDSYICLKEGIRNVILFQTKIQVHWVFGPVICRGQFAACANNFSFERLGHGPSSFSRKTYENEEGINFYKLLSNQSHLTHRR